MASVPPPSDHHTTVEEVPDIDLPEPIMMEGASSAGPNSSQNVEAVQTKTPQPDPRRLDIQSDESFPSLGSVPTSGKGKGPAASPSSWTKSPNLSTPQPGFAQSRANGDTNGSAKHLNQLRSPSGVSSPGMSTPSSGAGTPRVTSPWTGAPRPVMLPGQQAQTTEKLDLPAGWLIPREQLKRPLAEIIKAITTRTKTSVQISTSASKVTTFIIKGSPQNVAVARRDIAKELGARQTISLPFPSSARSLIIGKGGATIQGISKRYNVKIQMPKTEGKSRGDESDEMEEVLVEGDALGLQGAKGEIEALVGDRVITSNVKLHDVPPEFFPFIAGPHNSRVANLEANRGVRMTVPAYERWDRPPPLPTGPERPKFQPTGEHHIKLSGERSAVQLARNDVEQFVQTLHNGLNTSQIPINRGQHQFIAGPRGMSVHDFLNETGCAIVLPPDGADPDMLELITLVGPDSRLDQAADRVLDLASSMHSVSFDASRVFANAPMGPQRHLSNVQRYLKQQGELEQLEKQYESHIHMPEYGPWEVYSRGGRNTHLLRSELMNVMAGHPPSRMTTVDIDPYYHKHVVHPQRENLLSQHGVRAILPQDLNEQDPTILLVFEGASPDPYSLPKKQPSPTEIRQFEAGLEASRQQLLELMSGRPAVITRSIPAPLKHHDRVTKLLSREQQNIPGDGLPVRRRPTPAGGAPEDIMLQGADADIEALALKIAEMIAEEEENAREMGYTTSTAFPQAHMSQLVGRGGQRINKIRDEYEVDIQTKEGLVEIKGPKRRAEAAKAHVLGLGKQFADEARFVIKVKPQYHGELIGPKGQQINRLQDRYDVKIQFPRTTRQDHGNGEADSVSDIAARASRNQAPDEVEIRGPKRGAEQARSEILDLLQYITDHGHTSSVSIPAKFVPRVVGPQGREIEQIRLATGAQVEVRKNKGEGESDPNARAEITIKGSKKAVDEARKILEEKAKAFNASTTRNLTIDRKHHRTLIGANGNMIKDIVVKAGGPEDRRELAQIVRFPRAESSDDNVRVEGEKEMVERIAKALEEMVLSLDNQVTDSVEVAPEYHRILIGRGGDVRKELESRFGVTVNIPKQNSEGQAASSVRVIGPREKVDECKKEILQMVAQRMVETMTLTGVQHQALNGNGTLFKDLKSKFGVMVDYGGNRAGGGRQDFSRQRNGGGGGSEAPKKQVKKEEDKKDMPLITDQDQGQDYGWELYVDVPDEDEGKKEGTSAAKAGQENVTWTLKLAPKNSTSNGSDASGARALSPTEAIAQARAAIQAAVDTVDCTPQPASTSKPKKASEPMATGYLTLDTSLYRTVIGRGGSTIEGLKRETRCRISVPKQGSDSGSAIEIRGAEGDVLRCRRGILEVVKRA